VKVLMKSGMKRLYLLHSLFRIIQECVA
jgi:hypothetical protein